LNQVKLDPLAADLSCRSEIFPLDLTSRVWVKLDPLAADLSCRSEIFEVDLTSRMWVSLTRWTQIFHVDLRSFN
jgi:hypothetical protein